MKPFGTTIAKACLFLASISICQAVYADDDLYQVEVIIFKHISDPNLIAENWKQREQTEDHQSSVELVPFKAEEVIQPYQLLPEDNFVLTKEEAALAKQKNYEILLHIAWQQPIEDRKHAKSVHIFGGQAFDYMGNLVSDPESPINPDNPLNPDNPSDPENKPSAEHLQWELTGTIKAIRSRNFVLKSNLVFSQQGEKLESSELSTVGENDAIGLKHFYMDQSRGLRLDQLHYFDHPMFGMLAKITKVEVQPAEADDS